MDLYNCLDDCAVELDDLLKIHTGHEVQSAESDSDSKSEKSEEDNWPALFNPEQLKANVVNAKDLKGESTATENINFAFLNIAKSLNSMITNEFCYLCNKNGPGHYMAPGHYSKVSDWIKKQARTSSPNELKMIYCEVCNVGLDKNDNHYSTESHQRKLPYFCDICKTKFKSPITQGHFDKKHKGIIPQKFKEMPTTTQSNVTKATVPYTPTANPTNHQQIAARLQTLLTFTSCLVCGKTKLPTQKHYTTKLHIKKIRGWIQNHAQEFGYPGQKFESLYCVPCVDIFSSDEIAETHYQSQGHKDKLTLYCTLCDKIVKDMTKHVGNVGHKKREKNSIKRHNTVTTQNASWPQELSYLITLSKCDICLVKFENHNEAYTHYISQEHQDNVASWIANLENNKRVSEEPVKIVQPEDHEQTILKMKIRDEIQYAIDKLYFSNTFPLKEALEYLKKLNRDIADICNKRENEELILCEAPPKPRASVDDTSQFTNFKLNMELERLKMVLRKTDLIPPELGMQYTSNLVRMLKSLENQGIEDVDIDRIFDVYNRNMDLIESDIQDQFQRELDTLEIMVNGEHSKLSSDVVLNVITEFNVKLENSVYYYRDDDAGSSDDDNWIDGSK